MARVSVLPLDTWTHIPFGDTGTPGHFFGCDRTPGHMCLCVRVSKCPSVGMDFTRESVHFFALEPEGRRGCPCVHVSMCLKASLQGVPCHCVRIAFFIFTVRSPCRTMSVWLCVPVTHDYYVHIPLLALLGRNRDPMAAREYLSMLVLRHPLLFVGSGHRGDTRSNI